MLLQEKLRDITRPDRKNSIELVMLRNRGILTVRQLMQDANLMNHFRLRLLHFSYATLMDACLTTQDQIPITERYVPIGNGYKMSKKVTSKEIRIEAMEIPNETRFKLHMTQESMATILPKIKKLQCTRAKNLALRLLHGDIYTGTRLLKFGMTDTDKCIRCRQRENIEHLIKNCWYSAIIWSKIRTLYKKTDHRRQIYDQDSLDFVLGTRLSPAKIKLHLEVLRRLTNKERPAVLPGTLIVQTLDYLRICDKQHYKYYKKLRDAISANT